MNIKLNYVSIQNRITIYFLDLVNYSWNMGVNFGGMMLNQLNLNRAKKTLSSPYPHQNLSLKFNLL
jgi:hypothetical protein